MSINQQSLSRRSISVTQQKPQEYWTLDDKWPEYRFVQRIPSSTRTPTQLSFSAKSVDPNLFLRSKAVLKLQVSIQNEELDEKDLSFVINDPINADSVIYKKPGTLIANSMTNISLQINNIKVELRQPRYWQKYTTNQHAGKEIIENYFSTSGSSFPDWTGATDVNSGYPSETSLDNARIIGDRGINEAADAVFQDTGLVPGAQSIIPYTETLNIGCFNYLDDIDSKDIKNKSWYGKMTKLIPYVKQLRLDIALDDIAANSLVYLYSRRTIAIVPQPRVSRLTIADIVSAELVIEWVKPRREKLISLPPKVKIQSFFVDHREFAMNDGNVISDGNSSSVDIQNLVLHQVPSYIIIYATVDKDSPNYQCISITSSRDIAGLDKGVSEDNNSMESNLQLVDGTFQLRTNSMGGDTVISTEYSNRELYRITKKNSIKDSPWSFRQWTGGDSRESIYPPNTVVILGEHELRSFFVRKGQTVQSISLDFSANFTSKEGFGVRGSQLAIGGDKVYKLMIDFIYDRYFLQLDNCGNTYSGFDAKFL